MLLLLQTNPVDLISDAVPQLTQNCPAALTQRTYALTPPPPLKAGEGELRCVSLPKTLTPNQQRNSQALTGVQVHTGLGLAPNTTCGLINTLVGRKSSSVLLALKLSW